MEIKVFLKIHLFFSCFPEVLSCLPNYVSGIFFENRVMGKCLVQGLGEITLFV